MLARALAARRVAGYDAGAPADTNNELVLGALGSGSDYTPFLQHLGVNSVNLEFEGEADYGVYHSAYDSFDHFRRFVDPTFQYGITLAELAGRIVLRAAQAELLPAQESDFAASIAGYADELHKLVETMRVKTRDLNKLLDDDAYQLAADPERSRLPPMRDDDVPFLNFAELDNAVGHLQSSAKAFDAAYARDAADDAPIDARTPPASMSPTRMSPTRMSRKRINDALTGLEQELTDPHGLPGRVWYQHMIYAPGMHTGYGVKTLPGIREAIEERRWNEANLYIGVVARALNAYSTRLESAIASP